MTQQHRTALKELQKLDQMIHATRQRIQDFDPLFEEIEEPALVLESELTTSRNRVKEMKLEERRLERSAEEKAERIKRLGERLGSVRNLREEAAVSAELDMVKRSLQNDEQEAMSLIDQLRKGEERGTELEAAHALASAEVEPKRAQLLADREQARAELASMEKERAGFAKGMDAAELRIYEAIRDGGRRKAVSELTEDGACGNCFGMVPPQHQSDIRHGVSLIRCEACGVILAAASAVIAEDAAVAVSVEASTPNGADESSDDEGAGEEGE